MKVSLRGLRADRRMTQAEVAKKIGVSKRTIMKWENNETSPTGIQLMKLCEIYDVELNDIFLPDKLAKREQNK